MKVLTVFAHPASKSFGHAVLDPFDAGLRCNCASPSSVRLAGL